jgi:2-dehydro-3-deoxygluconokinase
VTVVTVGETMALLDAPASGRLGGALPVRIGGAESNVAIGLARLGVDCTWTSRVGDDALGTFVVREIRAEGVRVVATRDAAAPTGMMVKEHRGGRPSPTRSRRRTCCT